jgi:hypothetical protein
MNRMLTSVRRWLRREPPEDPHVGVRVPLRKRPHGRSAVEVPKDRLR